MDKKQFIKHLRRTQGLRTQKAFASNIGCSAAYLSDIYAGKREPGPKILKALGIKQETIYVKRWR